eukprot:7385581-Prymnesium_polylepis.1
MLFLRIAQPRALAALSLAPLRSSLGWAAGLQRGGRPVPRSGPAACTPLVAARASLAGQWVRIR